MSNGKKLLLATFTASLLVSFIASGAAALRSLSITERWIAILSTALTFTGGGLVAVCQVGQTIHHGIIIPKQPRNPFGRVEVKVLGQESGAERCTEGRIRVLVGRETEGEFNVNYLSFNGRLPTIAGLNIQLLRVAFQVTLGGGIAVCLVVANILGTESISAEGTLEQFSGSTEARFGLEEIRVTRVGGMICPEAREITLAGTFRSVGTIRIILL